ncbi:hypothetical protein CH253_16795 [Rhodococcus sp. 06-156-3C]|nr:hypothetical protein CH280_06120 [Rhodococcus sp. 06-156-4C]OZD18742.1 hypothetical protein CH253_16795 [Rhodococcus sp. 06-156-3C]OZD22252.1 hypothetical protein CH248_08380 [Rhodococcus sp. 06-156-4a]OZD34058.1 hypothetical protein CH247_08205 [Rhodococcus sp. 06-156-3b]OZD38795.1 hypothetical protein CH284_06625 [Rhodococcus sp. 06-156-3]OZF57255.1 hypothetical protein CH290_27410 [Rhodococcus sp. 06-156-4]
MIESWLLPSIAAQQPLEASKFYRLQQISRHHRISSQTVDKVEIPLNECRWLHNKLAQADVQVWEP